MAGSPLTLVARHGSYPYMLLNRCIVVDVIV